MLGIHCHHGMPIPPHGSLGQFWAGVAAGDPHSVPGTENLFCAQAALSLKQLILLACTSIWVGTLITVLLPPHMIKKKKKSFNSVEILLKDSSVCLCELPVDLLEHFAHLRSFSRTQCQGAQQKLFVPSLEYYQPI